MSVAEANTIEELELYHTAPKWCSYSLGPAELERGIQELTERAVGVSDNSLTPPAQYVLHEIAGTNQLSNIGRTIECGVFDEAFGNGPDTMQAEYAPYEEQSTFFIVQDTIAQDVLGVIRIAREAPIGFKTLVDLADCRKVQLQTPIGKAPSPDEVYSQHGIVPSRAIDVMTLAIPTEHRGIRSTDIMGALYHQTIDYSRRHRIGHWLMMLDEHAHGIISSIGVPLTAITGIGAISYLGSEKTLPLVVDAKQVHPQMQRMGEILEEAIKAGERKRATLRLNRGMLLGQNFRGQLQKIIW